MDLEALKISRRIAANVRGRDFIVGDLHGCYSALQRALKQKDFNPEYDRLFALGDLVDRGDESYECLMLLNEPWFYSVLGNHEYMMLAALRAGINSPEWNSWMLNGGFWFQQLDQEQYHQIKQQLPTLIDLPIAMTVEKTDGGCIGLCHAEPPGNDWQWFVNHPSPSVESIVKALWGREKIRNEIPLHVQGVDATFHGHTFVAEHKVIGNMHFVDTGAYLNQRITLIELNDAIISRQVQVA